MKITLSCHKLFSNWDLGEETQTTSKRQLILIHKNEAKSINRDKQNE